MAAVVEVAQDQRSDLYIGSITGKDLVRKTRRAHAISLETDDILSAMWVENWASSDIVTPRSRRLDFASMTERSFESSDCGGRG